MSTTRNSDLCRFFFAVDTDHYFVCNYCSARRKQLPSSGYANMISHLKDKHPGYVEDYTSHQSRQAGLLRTFGFVNPTASNMYRWIEWVVTRNMPLSEVDDPLTRGMSKLQPVCSKMPKRYMTLLVDAVEAKITAEMSGQYGYMYDASTFYLENYVALYAVYWYDEQMRQVLLAIAPMEEGDLAAPSSRKSARFSTYHSRR
ncbi:hypothetical protein F444_06132 [Phytophthora nicotianae P1976]|uniref:BED-type domain-containing protein n=1 Tax=Phytophthora nicotianae P1976 TaxID=1317066 RepID=A0A081AJN1_PHYNI|nr:hypothetical protein F444_06132 [Phytophthora nicotianae P1976]